MLSGIILNKIDVGMIGAGNHANLVHYPSLADIADVNIAAICDLNQERLNRTADKYRIKERFTDYKQMLDEIDVDAVYIIMAPHLLDPLVMYCLKKKKHVFVEKPPGGSLEETERWAREAKANDCLTMVAFNRRFVPVAVEAKKIVEDSGPIIQCMVTFHKYTRPEERAAWRNNYELRKNQSGAIAPYMDDECHAVDLLRWAGGDVKNVHSYVSKHYCDETNTYNALVEFESGAIGIFNANRASGARIHNIELHSKYTWAFVDLGRDLHKLNAIVARKSDSPYARPQTISSQALEGISGPSMDTRGFPPLYKYYGYYHENLHYIRCIKENRQPQTSFEDAVKTMELIVKIQSGVETKPIV